MPTDFHQYSGQYVAMVDQKVIAAAKTGKEAYVQAKRSFPSRIVSLMYVPTKKETITFL